MITASDRPSYFAIKILLIAISSAALTATARSAVTVTMTADDSGTYPRSMQWQAPARTLTIDLSKIPREADVFRAELILHPPGNRPLPKLPTRVFEKGRPAEPLKFVAPRFQSLDALEAVRRAHRNEQPLILVVETTCNGVARLEVSHTGSCDALPSRLPSAAKLRAIHRKGQTLITFQEPRLSAFPAFERGRDVMQFAKRLEQDHAGIRFRFWRSTRPIRDATIRHAKLVGECGLMTCWNRSYHQNQTASQPPLRYRIVDNGPPLDWGTGVYAHNPRAAGQAYYAVTVAVDGQEDFAQLGRENSLSNPIEETIGMGEPILQWIEKTSQWTWRQAPRGSHITRLIYTRWESFPHASGPSFPIDYLVVMGAQAGRAGTRSPSLAMRTEPAPVGLHLHAWGGSLNHGYGWWYNAHRGAVLIASNQIPYDWWTGYHVSYATHRTWADGDVHPFTIDRLYGFLDWASTQWRDGPDGVRDIWPKIDRTRVFTAGNSMGGSGAVMHAVRLGDRVAWGLGWVGVHKPGDTSYQTSYARVYGPKQSPVKVAGTAISPWDYFDDEWWLRNHVGRETAYIIASNGKNDKGIGWPQAVKFARALQDTRRPHQFNWDVQGHSTRTLVGPNFEIDVRVDQSLPAFTNCSLDDDIGTGTLVDGGRYDGDAKGAFNAHLSWSTDDIVDEESRWELTVLLSPSAPQQSCVVDLTPRRLQRFKTDAGTRFHWNVAHAGQTTHLATGQVTADEFDLVTLTQIPLRKGRNRVVIVRAGSE